MTRLLLALFPLLVVVPHLIPLPDHKVQGSTDRADAWTDKDDGRPLLSQSAMEKLVQTNPMEFLHYCWLRHVREVKGYTMLLVKQERIKDRFEKKEEVYVWFKEEPHSVFMKWKSGQRLASRALYVEGENDGEIVIKPAGLAAIAGTVTRNPEGEDAYKSGRYTLNKFGIKMGLQRTLVAWDAARRDGTLHLECDGKKQYVEELDRECWILRRHKFAQPEKHGVDVHGTVEQIVYIDCDTWLMLGTVLTGEDGKLIGEYLFRDVRLNPEFSPEQFTPKVVSK